MTAVAVAVLAVLASVGTYLAVGRQSTPRWSVPRQIPGASLLDSVGCASPSFCTTADFSGDVFEYNGSSWSPLPLPVPGGQQGFKAHGAGCLSLDFCSAFFRVGGSTDLYFYDGTTWHPEIVDGRLSGRYRFYLSTIWCPTSSSCVAIGTGVRPTAETAVYDNGSWAAPTIVRLGHHGSSITDVPYALSCTSSQFCAALNGSRSPLEDRDGHWSQGRPIAGADALTSVSCASSSFCAAVDKHGNAYLFDGRTWSTAIRVDPGRANDLLSISCADQFCGAIDSGGRVVTFGDGSWSPATLVDPGSRPADISCPATNNCIVVDQAGRYIRLS